MLRSKLYCSRLLICAELEEGNRGGWSVFVMRQLIIQPANAQQAEGMGCRTAIVQCRPVPSKRYLKPGIGRFIADGLTDGPVKRIVNLAGKCDVAAQRSDGDVCDMWSIPNVMKSRAGNTPKVTPYASRIIASSAMSTTPYVEGR